MTILGEVLLAAERSIAPRATLDRPENVLAGLSEAIISDGKTKAHNIAIERGRSDHVAVQRLYHHAELHSRLLPDDSAARAAFCHSENVRIQYLGVRHWPGMRVNFNALFGFEVEQIVSESYFWDRPGSKSSLAYSIAMAERLLNFEVSDSLKSHMGEDIRRCEEVIAASEGEIAGVAGDQFSFACVVHRMLHEIGLEQRLLDEKELRRRMEDLREEFDPSELMKKRRRQVEQEFEGSDKGAEDIQRVRRVRRRSAPVADAPGKSRMLYRPYTVDYDEIIRAADLLDASELTDLRSRLDVYLQSVRSAIGILANRLQRRLQTLQQSVWIYDLEEGMLDVSKLTRVITDPVLSASYKVEQESELGSIVVCALIDNSASMKGEPIALAACCADILSQALERCGVKLEVLGFTTSQWNGGCSRQQWSASREPMPGRLNDLRHIIYKAADEKWRRCKTAFALMLKEDILKENIDGEALLWAYDRLRSRGEAHRILLVISDGAPADHATLTLNGRDYLSENLRHVVHQIETEGQIELLGIGVGHDLSKIYKRSARIDSMSSLASVVTSELVSLFEQSILKRKFA